MIDYLSDKAFYRSLLQKAVRRGDTELVDLVANHMHLCGDGQWVRRRASIITFEECYTMAINIPFEGEFSDVVNHLLLLAESAKHKNASGLGTLGYALYGGNQGVLEGLNPAEAYCIRLVAAAIQRPENFWDWIFERVKELDIINYFFVKVAKKAYCQTGFPWDKAIIQAGAYLSTVEEISNFKKNSEVKQKNQCSPWIAFDKHTPQGREVLKKTSNVYGISYEKLSTINFYYESSICNLVSPSAWWDKEINWSLKRINLGHSEAFKVWSEVKPFVTKNIEHENGNLLFRFEQLKHRKGSTNLSKQLELVNRSSLCF